VKEIFSKLRPQQVKLLKAIAEKPEIDDSFLHIPYSEEAQWDFGVDVITRFGFDWNRGRQDKSVHPFTTSFGIGDVRVTTRFDPERAASSLFSTMHEADMPSTNRGSISPWRAIRWPPCFHGRSRIAVAPVGEHRRPLAAFWNSSTPDCKRPSHPTGERLSGKVYRGINKVEPSFIRTEADEATYNLHIMLRLELEIALIEGSLAVKDLPGAWNARMKDYLGIVPPNNRLGVLQDVHWSSGLLGYFPTYALAISSPPSYGRRSSSTSPPWKPKSKPANSTNCWLGCARTSTATALNSSRRCWSNGSPVPHHPEPYMRYLNKKYSEIYDL